VFARDASTVVFELCDADPAFLSKIASPALAIDDTAWLQSHIDPSAQQQPILTQVNGTGPYRLDAWDGSGDITLSRYDGYWGTPALTPSIIFVGEEDAGQRFSLVAGHRGLERTLEIAGVHKVFHWTAAEDLA